jgi:predicted nucleic acid-binding protein
MKDALRALAAADDFVQTMPLTGLDERVIAWAAANAMASYDSEFVIAAEVADLRLVTADKMLVSKCPCAVLPNDFALGL